MLLWGLGLVGAGWNKSSNWPTESSKWAQVPSLKFCKALSSASISYVCVTSLHVYAMFALSIYRTGATTFSVAMRWGQNTGEFCNPERSTELVQTVIIISCSWIFSQILILFNFLPWHLIFEPLVFAQFEEEGFVHIFLTPVGMPGSNQRWNSKPFAKTIKTAMKHPETQDNMILCLDARIRYAALNKAIRCTSHYIHCGHWKYTCLCLNPKDHKLKFISSHIQTFVSKNECP